MVRGDLKIWQCDKPHCKFRVLTVNGEPTDHDCPYIGGDTKVSWTVYGSSLLEQAWTELDTQYAALVDPANASTKVEWDKGFMRGIAWMVAKFMVPHFTTPEDVVREVVKRYKMKEAGEDYETPGLRERRYQPPPDDGKLNTSLNPSRARATNTGRVTQRPAREMPKSDLPAAQVAAIRKSPRSDEDLAELFGIGVAIVKAIRSPA